MKKNQDSNRQQLAGDKKAYRAYAAVALTITIMHAFSPAVYASNDPIAVVNNLSEFIFGLIRAIGLILLGFGIVQVGMSLCHCSASFRD